MGGSTTKGRIRSYNPITMEESCTIEIPEGNVPGGSPLNKRNHKNKVWITNGQECTYVAQGTPLPDGWYLGMCYKDDLETINEHKRQAHLGHHWYTNGKESIYTKEPCPEGWWRGKHKHSYRSYLWQ